MWKVLPAIALKEARLAKRGSILILTRLAVKTGLKNGLTGHYWSIGGPLKWLIGSIRSQAYKCTHICLCPLDIIVNVVQLLLLRHKAGQEERGEILLENSFMR